MYFQHIWKLVLQTYQRCLDRTFLQLPWATEKFALPYLVLSPPQHATHRAENLITVNPAPEDIFKLTADILKYLQWTDVAVIYDSDEGNISFYYARVWDFVIPFDVLWRTD